MRKLDLPQPGGPRTSDRVPGMRYVVMSFRMLNTNFSFLTMNGRNVWRAMLPTVGNPESLATALNLVTYDTSLARMICAHDDGDDDDVRSEDAAGGAGGAHLLRERPHIRLDLHEERQEACNWLSLGQVTARA